MDQELRSEFELNDGVRLRTFSEDDAEDVLRVVLDNRDHLKVFMRWMSDDYSIATAHEFIARAESMRAKKENTGFGIFRGETIIGSIGFVYFDWTARKTEIGYWIAKDEEGKGIISAAAKRLIEYAFEELGMNRIEIRCSRENVRSEAVPLRLGFVKEGEFRQAELIHGKLHDFNIYALLAEDPRLW